MKHVVIAIVLVLLSFGQSFAWGEEENVGRCVLGDNIDTLFEVLPIEAIMAAKAGDIIATKKPALFCDFTKQVLFNSYDTAFCSYIPKRKILSSDGKTELSTLQILQQLKEK